MTKVINIRTAPTGWQSNPNYQYIGRAGKGMTGFFGNPIIVGKTCEVCGEVHRTGGSTIDCYTRWLSRRMIHDMAFRNAVYALKDKTLVCFCKPAQCHGDVLAQAADAA
jgi:hypothetical protein